MSEQKPYLTDAQIKEAVQKMTSSGIAQAFAELAASDVRDIYEADRSSLLSRIAELEKEGKVFTEA